MIKSKGDKTKKGGFKVTNVNSLRTTGLWWGI